MGTTDIPCICSVINLPLINENGNKTEPLLHLICSNSLGKIIKFIFYVSDSLDIFNVQDDDGNTPLHLLCKRIELLDIDYSDYHSNYSDYEIFGNISSEPSSTKVFELLKFLSQYVDFSIKNNDGKTINEFNDNVIINNICYIQMVHKNMKDFPLNRPDNMYYERISHKSDWNELFKLKDSSQKNRTLLHYLLMGDRLSAIKFLVDQGADVNYRKRINKGRDISYGPTAISKLFKEIDFPYDYNKNGYNHSMDIELRVPSGFKEIPKIKSGWPKDYNNLMAPREKRILEETEKIAEFLIERCSDSTLNFSIPYCDFSNAMFEAYKKRKIQKTSVIDNIKNITKKISYALMDNPCFPFGNNDDKNKYYDDIKDVKYIKLESGN